MKKKIAMSWANALRSGLYTRTTQGVLKHGVGDNETYDALGVLAELAVKNGKAKWKLSSPVMPGVWWIDDESPFWLSQNVKKWAGMDLSEDDDLEDTIIERFDAGMSFNEIANFIERSWEVL